MQKPVRLRLIQVRERRIHEEYEAFKGSIQNATSQLLRINALEQVPSLDWLEGVDGIIIGGSPMSVYDEHGHLPKLQRVIEVARRRRLPLLGVCFGAQLIAHTFEGVVSRSVTQSEHGTYPIRLTTDVLRDPLFDDMPIGFRVQQSHDQSIERLPKDALLLAKNSTCPHQAFVLRDAPMYGLQFHPELTKADYEALLDQRTQSGEQSLIVIEEIRKTLMDTPHSPMLLQRFVSLCSSKKSSRS